MKSFLLHHALQFSRFQNCEFNNSIKILIIPIFYLVHLLENAAKNKKHKKKFEICDDALLQGLNKMQVFFNFFKNHAKHIKI